MGSGVFSGVWPTASIVATEFIIWYFTIRYITQNVLLKWPDYGIWHAPTSMALLKQMLANQWNREKSSDSLTTLSFHCHTYMHICICNHFMSSYLNYARTYRAATRAQHATPLSVSGAQIYPMTIRRSYKVIQPRSSKVRSPTTLHILQIPCCFCSHCSSNRALHMGCFIYVLAARRHVVCTHTYVHIFVYI